MIQPRRQFLRLAAGAAALPALSRAGRAQGFPARPIRLVIGFSAGGTVDIMARIVSQYLAERLGQQIVIENRAGAGGNIATENVVKAPADGYTLLLVTMSNTINASLYGNLAFDIVHDIAPICGLVDIPYVMEVHPSVPATNARDFIAHAKAHPGKIDYASSGNGSASHLAGELFKMSAGVDMQHVPYRDSALPDLLAGRVQVYFSPIPTSIDYLRTGKLRALGVSSLTRQETLPDTPTLAEAVPGFEANNWIGMGAPKLTPPEIIDRLNREINAVLVDPRFTARLASLGGVALAGSAADFGRRVADDTEKWRKVIRALNLSL